MMKRAVLAVAVVLAASAPAFAATQRDKQFHYIGIHPIEASEVDFCYIEGPHVHIYGADKVRYRDHHGHHYFVGDPVAYGYDGPKYAYKGHHPIHVHVILGSDDHDVEHCYLDGPHYHSFAPPEGPEFKLAGGAYFYVGAPSKPYIDARPAMIQINAIYRPLVYARPVVVVAAPVGWIGARVEFAAAPVIVAPRAGISIDAHIRLPSVQVHVVPGVIVHDRYEHRHRHRHGHYKYKKHKRHKRHW